jgi:hypothetical protein
MSSDSSHPISASSQSDPEVQAQQARQLIHQLMNQLEIISGCAHLLGLHPALGPPSAMIYSEFSQRLARAEQLHRPLARG